MAKKPRSPTTGKVFDAFIAELREQPEVDEEICERLQEALSSGQAINPAALKNALFPKDEGNDV